MGEILGIGIEELIFVGILIALLFGPESIPKMARTAGRALNRLFRSPLYRESQQIRKQIQDLPAALARLAELEEMQKNLNNEISDLRRSIDPGLSQVAPSTTLSPTQPAASPGAQVEPPTSDASPREPGAPGADHSIEPPHAPAPPAADELSNAIR
ncbi:MAG TPA: twin-arginine translocase TatA/TatE family subunit [Anaerolineae bacterium]|nr:twin-arginine translocase TatA/TatE family subunit [Anaerolineae bacterium]